MASEDPPDSPAPDTGPVGTPWSRTFATPVRAFLQTEQGSAGVLVAGIVVALVWANVGSSYESVWTTPLGFRLGHHVFDRDLRYWVNSGLMTFFFLVVGLEARREIDLGDLRDRRRFLLPAAAGLVGMLVPVGIYLAVNAGGDAADGWGTAMSTDTALALGLLVMVGREVPDRVRTFLLTVFVVDDIVALLVIAVMYTDHVHVWYLLLALVLFGVLLLLKNYRMGTTAVFVAGVAVWGSVLASGVDPVVSGLVIGLSAGAYTPVRDELEQATGLFRQFREEPTPDLARSAALGLTRTLSPNDRLQRFYHPWSSYVIVPLFALANAGIAVDGAFLERAVRSPVTLGILLGYVVGKPVAVVSASWAIARVTHGRVQPAVGWAAVTGSGAIAGIGFTVSFLIAALAFHGERLAEAKLGVLLAAAIAALATWVIFRVTDTLPPHRRAVALFGRADQLVDLAADVDPDRDHIRGPEDAIVTLVEYGDFQCPYCGQAEPAVRTVLGSDDVRFVWRHLPLPDVHPQAEIAAQASEAAAEQGRFWEMHDLLLDRQDHLLKPDLLAYAEELGLDVPRFTKSLFKHVHAGRVGSDVESADISGVSGTPTFFVNGERLYGAFDAASLTAAVSAARSRARIAASG
ncbi:MAG TPA: Na+/H+ antiporter NhaA [Nocardioides sp.]|nr:Na+/H+ antiporter NhaA [Nocardioides sp.]